MTASLFSRRPRSRIASFAVATDTFSTRSAWRTSSTRAQYARRTPGSGICSVGKTAGMRSWRVTTRGSLRSPAARGARVRRARTAMGCGRSRRLRGSGRPRAAPVRMGLGRPRRRRHGEIAVGYERQVELRMPAPEREAQLADMPANSAIRRPRVLERLDAEVDADRRGQPDFVPVTIATVSWSAPSASNGSSIVTQVVGSRR